MLFFKVKIYINFFFTSFYISKTIDNFLIFIPHFFMIFKNQDLSFQIEEKTNHNITGKPQYMHILQSLFSNFSSASLAFRYMNILRI